MKTISDFDLVKQDGMNLQYVSNQTEAICLEAVKQTGIALAFVRKQTYEICLTAFNQDVKAADYIDPEFQHLFEF